MSCEVGENPPGEPSFEPEAVDEKASSRAGEWLDSLAKPTGSLGRLEGLGRRLAGAQHRVPPVADSVRTILFVASHRVAEEREVSAYPSSATRRMLASYAEREAAVNVFAQRVGAELEVVDLGVAEAETPVESGAAGPSVRDERIRERGAGDVTREPATGRGERAEAVRVGAERADAAVEAGSDLIALGEMGIGNTTGAAAAASRLLEVEPGRLTGRGSGVEGDRLEEKRRAVRAALERSDVPPSRPIAVLGDVGGLELVALAGAILRAAERRRPVLLDGFVVGVAALAAVRFHEAVRGYLVPATRSPVRGHDRILEALEAGEPLLDWEMRLGEGSAATLSVGPVRAACDLFEGMAGLEEVLERGGSR